MEPFITLALASYFLGSIPFGKIIAKIFYDIDIQKRGSGNIGFANVLRVIGWKAAIPTLLGDAAKGYVPTFVAYSLTGSVLLAGTAGTIAVLGHMFPIWLRFKGGKGVATSFGVMIALNPLSAMLGGASYIAMLKLTASSSAGASIIGVIIALTTGVITQPASWWQYSILALVVTWGLRHNLTGKLKNHDK